MELKQALRLVRGQRYEFVFLELDERMRTYKKRYVGEFRGWNTLPDWEDFLLFWIDGEYAASDFRYGDIVEIKRL